MQMLTLTTQQNPNVISQKRGGILPQMADVVEWIATADNRATWTFETSTRKGEGVFSESRKKGLLIIANPVYGYSAPAKSGVGIGVLITHIWKDVANATSLVSFTLFLAAV